MKRELGLDDVLAAVWGGAILGGGGGGMLDEGERMARLALEVSRPQLWSCDEFAPQALTATVALVGAPAAPHPHVDARQLLRTVELLRRELPMGAQLAALHTNENGAQTTVNGWFHAAMIGLPVMDFACNGRAHPTSMMGALGLHSEDDYQSVQCFAGGRGARSTEGVARGSLAAASGIVRRASVEAGGLVAVARNPVTVGYALAHGAPGAISHAMAVGQHFLEGGLAAVAAFLGGRIVAEGVVAEYACRQDGGLDVGHLRLDDEGGTFIAFVNEYMLLDQAGRRMADFPDLIMTFDGQGKPVVSAHVKTGMPLQVLRVPADRLLLSRTMRMPELFDPVRALLGMDFGPVQQDVLQTAI